MNGSTEIPTNQTNGDEETEMEEETRTILLVEDNPDDEALAIRAIKRSTIDCDVAVVRDGEAALEYLLGPDPKPLPSLLLLDLKLPKVDGKEVVKKLRENDRTRRLPIVILTTSKEEQDILDSYNFGCNSYIHKPVDFYEFVMVVAQLGQYWLVLNQPPTK